MPARKTARTIKKGVKSGGRDLVAGSQRTKTPSKRPLASSPAKTVKGKKGKAEPTDAAGLFASLFDKVSGLLFIVTVEPRGCFRFSAVNRALLDITGLKESQIAGKTVQEVIPKPSCDMVLKKYREAIRTGQTVSWEETSVYPAGERHGEVAVTPVFDGKGRATHLFGIVHDITARKNAEDALRKSESRFRVSLDHSPIVIWHQDKEFKYTWIWNPDAKFDPNSLIGKSAADILPAEEVAHVSKIKRRVLRTGTRAREEVQFTIDGRVFLYDYSVEPLRDEGGRIQGLVGVAIDITSRKEIEKAMQDSEERYRFLADHTDDIVTLTDTLNNNLYISPSYFRETGWTFEELEKTGWCTRVHPDDRDLAERTRLENLTGKQTTIEIRISRRDGSWMWVESTCKPIPGPNGKVWRLLIWGHNITARKKAEEALRLSEERYARAARATNEGLWEWNLDTNKTYLSPRWKALLGFAPHELPDDREIAFFARLHPDDVQVVNAAREAKMARLMPYSVEVRLRMKSGEYRWFQACGQAEGDAHGRPVRMSGSMSDITERKEAEQALRHSEERFRAIFEQAAMGVGTIDADTDRFLQVNQQYCNITGRTREEMLAGSFVEMTHPDDLATNLSWHEKLKAGEITQYTLEKRYIRPDGSVVWGHVHAARLASKSGAPVQLLAVVEDITERKKAEAQYLRELTFNETLVNHTSAIIVLLDDTGRMIYVNKATLQLFGYRRAEMVNHTPWEIGLMDAAETLRTKERLGRLLRGEANPPRGVVLKGKDGTLHPVELSSITTRTPDGLADRIIVTGTDLTERHHLQREILRISEQEQARIGHNLHDGVGQTMTGVASMMEAFESELTGEHKVRAARIREFIRDAIQEVRQMSHSLSPTAVKNRGLVGALQLLADTIRTNHRTGCTLEVDQSIRIADPEKETHIYRIAQEAANNAMRHGGAQNIIISLQHQGDHECVLKIEDDGTGFKKRENGDAPGIGIRVMDYRASCIGGTLEVTSAGRRGVSVTCRFPCEGNS